MSSAHLFNSTNKVDFSIFLKTFYDFSLEFDAAKQFIQESKLSPLQFFKMLDPHCKCQLTVHDMCSFIEEYTELGNGS